MVQHFFNKQRVLEQNSSKEWTPFFLVGIVQETDWRMEGRYPPSFARKSWWMSIDLDPPETCESPQNLGVEYATKTWRVKILDLPPTQ